MIKFGVVGLSLSLPVGRALFACTHPDGNKHPALSVGIDGGEVCATDGHTALRFEQSEQEEGARDPAHWNGRYFTRELLERQIKAAGRTGAVFLEWSMLTSGCFPKIGTVAPAPNAEVTLGDAVMFDACYLARLELVAKACRRERLPGEATAPPLPGVLLTALGTSLEPARFKVGGPEWITITQHVGWFTIMPMRHNDTRIARKFRRVVAEATAKQAAKPRRKRVA